LCHSRNAQLTVSYEKPKTVFAQFSVHRAHYSVQKL
jgi:hypothetical protein